MKLKDSIDKYSKIVWNNQLPLEEESFLNDLINGQNSNTFRIDYNADYSLYLAYNASKLNYEGYSEEQTNELKKLLKNFIGQKLLKIPSMSKVFRLLNENNIIPIVVKGAALMAYYAPDIPRMMGDIDIYIKPEDYDRGLKLILDNGYEFVNDTGYHVAVTSKDLDIDVHRYIFKNGGDINSSFYDDLIEVDFLGSKIYVLSPENMLIHQLVNRGEDITTNNHPYRHFKWIIDCYYILNKFNADTVSLVNKAKDVNNFYNALLTLDKLIKLFPEKFSDNNIEIDDKNYAKWLNALTKSIKEFDTYQNQTKHRARHVYKNKYYIGKMTKYRLHSHRSAFHFMLKNNGINSVNDFFFRSKRFLKNNR